MAAVATSHAQYVEDSIDVGHAWVGSLAYNSREDVLYGRCQQASIFFAISCDSNKVINSYDLSYPRQMAYDSIDNKAYCAYEGAEEESLAVIDGRTHALIKSIRMPGATTPVWDPASDRVYVSCQSTNKVAVVDCATDSLLEYISVGACPLGMYINTLRRKLYVMNADAGTVSVINMETNQVVKTVATGTAGAGYYSRSVDKFYCTGDQGHCAVIGGQSDSVVVRVTLPGNASMMSAAGNEKKGLVYVGTASSSGSEDYVATLSMQNDSLLDTTFIGREPWGVACFEPSGLVYCASAITNQVCVLDGTGIVATLSVGDYPYVFASVPRYGRLYLGHLASQYVYVLRDTSAGVSEQQHPWPEFSDAVSAVPNPFASSVTLVWNSPHRVGGVVRAYAQDGRLVRQVRMPAGNARWVWDGRDDAGNVMAPGVYVVETGTGGRQKVVKLQ